MKGRSLRALDTWLEKVIKERKNSREMERDILDEREHNNYKTPTYVLPAVRPEAHMLFTRYEENGSSKRAITLLCR